MIDLVEIAERSERGPKMGESEWDFGLFKKMEELKKRHSLEYKGSDTLELSNEYADRAFEAAVDFLAEAGVYCVTTNTVIHFTREEVLEAARMAPREITVGAGRDSRMIYERSMEDSRPPNVRGNGHCPYPDNLGGQVLRCYAKIPRTDLVEGFNFTSVEGREVHGLPLEVRASRKEMAIMREAVRSAGRAGLSITLYPISTRAGALISAMDEQNGLRKTDGTLLSILPEIKVESEMIAAAIAYEEYGSYKVNGGAFSLIGDYCGGPEGAIVEVIAKVLAAWLVYRDSIHYSVSVEGHITRMGLSLFSPITEETKNRPPPRWTALVPSNALRRNSNIICWGSVDTRVQGGEPGSVSSFLANAGSAIGSTVFGLHLHGGPTPFEESFSCEASDATIKAHIKREEAHMLLEKLEEGILQAMKGEGCPVFGHPRERRMNAYIDFEGYFKPLTDAYDFVRGVPTQKSLEGSEEARKTLRELGIPV